ncbi:MAG: mono/diheme cytochrome c family protein [Candidatus Latescibacterota bacterium]|jgi:mono/diheme cytochrome c family protein
MRLFSIGLSMLLLSACSDDPLQESNPTGPSGEPDIIELGLRLIPEGVDLHLSELSAAETDLIARGSYIINGTAGCNGCHSSEAGYLTGGQEFPSFLGPDISGHATVVARNLTPHPESGMQLTEGEFIESMRTGKDFHDSEGRDPSRLLFMPTQVYRFMIEDDLKAVYAYLQRIPPIDNAVRMDYLPGFPFPPVPSPLMSEGGDEDGSERGLLIPQLFSSGPAAERFAAQFADNVAALSAGERAQVGRGSYLVNAHGDCSNCHTDGIPDGLFDSGLLPQSVDVNTEAYLAGGVDIGFFFGLSGLFTRNLTPHSETGLEASESEFVQVMRFGSDLHRPGFSLRVQPHFPADFRMTLEDLQAVYAFLRQIPPVDNSIEISP